MWEWDDASYTQGCTLLSLLWRAAPGLLAYQIRRESRRGGSELSLRNLGPDVVLSASSAFTTATRGITTEGILGT
jgi:hypothetical protein